MQKAIFGSPFRFDLQQFAEAPKTKKAYVELSDAVFTELSLIGFGTHSPRNGDARVLGVKAAPIQSALGKMMETLGFKEASEKAAKHTEKGWLVSVDVPDNVDHDGDGAADYELLASKVMSLYWDLSAIMGISSDSARAVAVVSVLDTFHKNYMDVYAGGDGEVAKARAIVAKADALSTLDDDPGVDYADGETLESVEALVEQFLVEKADKEPYGNVTYADPGYQNDKKKRYPIDTKAHVRAAASYFAKASNRKKYSASQIKAIDGRIAAAKRKMGIGAEKAGPYVIDYAAGSGFMPRETAKAFVDSGLLITASNRVLSGDDALPTDDPVVGVVDVVVKAESESTPAAATTTAVPNAVEVPGTATVIPVHPAATGESATGRVETETPAVLTGDAAVRAAADAVAAGQTTPAVDIAKAVTDAVSAALATFAPRFDELKAHVDEQVGAVKASIMEDVQNALKPVAEVATKASADAAGASDILTGVVQAQVEKARMPTAAGGTPIATLEGGTEPHPATQVDKGGMTVEKPRWAKESPMAAYMADALRESGVATT